LRTPLLIDTDTASDDAVALILALRDPAFEVLAITVVAGNVPVTLGSRNARYTVELCGASVPGHEGAAAPLRRAPADASFFHGQDGLGDQGYPPPKAPAAKGHAADVLVERIRARPGILLVTLGPLTNVALALERAPDIASKVGRCVVMGGAACTVGNVTPAAEYNIWCDPEAARAVFRSGMPIEMVGWELCRGAANLDDADIARCRALGTTLADFAIDANALALEANRRLFHDPGIGLPDPVAMAVALEPAIAMRTSRHAVEIECASPLTRGMTVVDALDVVPRQLGDPAGWPEAAISGPPHVTVVWQIDVARFKERVFRALA
jgi:inosine-uridine nucleoside N-ribohydrolase